MSDRKFYQEAWTDEQMESWDFWNAFNGMWGLAQSQPGFDPTVWLSIREYIKKIEPKGHLPPVWGKQDSKQD